MSMLKVKSMLLLSPVTLKQIWKHIAEPRTHFQTLFILLTASSPTEAQTVQIPSLN